MAYIPQKTETDIATLMEVMHTQSQHVSKNKLTSAARTLSTTLSDWLKLCSPNSVNSVKKKPEIMHTFHPQTAINDKAYQKKKEKNGDNDEDKDSDSSEGIPECIDNDEWKAFWLTLWKLIDYMSSQKNVFSQVNNVMTKIKSRHHTELLSRVEQAMFAQFQVERKDWMFDI